MKELPRILLRFISLILGIDQPESFPPPLKKDEEIEAFRRMRAGDKKAREIIIERRISSDRISSSFSNISSKSRRLV